MRQSQSIILYAFITLIILIGVGLFVFRDSVVDKLLNYNINDPVAAITRVASSSEFKLDILRDSRIKALKNYINIFDYEDINKSQDIILKNSNKPSDIIISNPDETAASSSTSTVNIIRVRVGNSNPFLVNKSAK